MDKEWLFAENIRLNKLEQELTEQRKILELEKEKLAGEKRVFEQQKKVLEIGFQKLAADKEMFRDEIKKQERDLREKASKVQKEMPGGFRGPGFFSGVTGYASLKKRYKELIRIYHPDNKNGDSFAVACINREYEILREQYGNKKC